MRTLLSSTPTKLSAPTSVLPLVVHHPLLVLVVHHHHHHHHHLLLLILLLLHLALLQVLVVPLLASTISSLVVVGKPLPAQVVFILVASLILRVASIFLPLNSAR